MVIFMDTLFVSLLRVSVLRESFEMVSETEKGF